MGEKILTIIQGRRVSWLGHTLRREGNKWGSTVGWDTGNEGKS